MTKHNFEFLHLILLKSSSFAKFKNQEWVKLVLGVPNNYNVYIQMIPVLD